MNCTDCDRPLECDGCGALYGPRTEEEYAALSRPEVPVRCHECGEVIVCRWCKTPYDGQIGEDGGEWTE